MRGLLRKDLFVAEKSSRLLLVLALAFSMTPSLGTFGSTYAMMLAFMMPLNSIAYDERCKWDRYAAMMPYTPGQLVGSKYVLSYIYTLLAECILILGAAVRSRLSMEFNLAEEVQTGLLLVVAMAFVTALGLPALYRFGTERGRLVMILVLGVGTGVALGITGVLKEIPGQPSLPFPAVLFLAAGAAVLITVLSFRLSLRFYKGRQNGAYS